MKNAPYSLFEAQQICHKWQNIVGKPFADDNPAVIESIAIAPFDQLSRERFIAYYLLFNDAEVALAHEYKGLLFNVLVIATSDDKYEIFHEDIYPWLAANQMITTDSSAAFPGLISEIGSSTPTHKI